MKDKKKTINNWKEGRTTERPDIGMDNITYLIKFEAQTFRKLWLVN